MKKLINIIKEALPIVIMIGLIPWITNDYALTAAYIILIVISFSIKREEDDGAVFIFGFVALTISEYFFVSTGVETFLRHSLFNIMPLWLPFLWAYGFVAIKRAIGVLNK